MTLIVRVFADISGFIRAHPPAPRYPRRIPPFSGQTFMLQQRRHSK